ncbi:serine/threonine-protein phosphatase 6 regulatory subunit [Anaeramoeba ignava]|uniref:Serine/threonine-protein phosphatase 6 regulatory subunit n=1 Tax=Anaeramoeba ignava TaxID=1746090 RepID=A0A9Q0RHG1_ANAIG|nr:serine/threonine-protein phosphatase 6 regulatory subunit [Anaeramoeba ignava]
MKIKFKIKIENELKLKLNLKTINLIQLFVKIADYELENLKDKQENEISLSFISPKLWKCFINCLFDNENNNIYHIMFYHLFDAVVKLENEKSLQEILITNKFLSRLIEKYFEDEKRGFHSGLSGFIILFCNIIRLKASLLQENHFICKHLKNLEIWNQFQEKLDLETFKLVSNKPSINAKSHFSPKIFQIDKQEYNSGYKIGSEYACALGFFQK